MGFRKGLIFEVFCPLSETMKAFKVGVLQVCFLAVILGHAAEPAGTVVPWGLSLYGQTNAPTPLIDIRELSAGEYHSLARRGDGIVVAWGSNEATNVPADLTNVTAVSAGRWHSLALRSDGTVAAWGLNDYGQSSVPTGLKGIKAVAGGAIHSLALRQDGMVVAWGRTNSPQAKVPPILTNVTAIAASYLHNLALRNDTTVFAWGIGESLTNVPPGLSNVVAISAGQNHSLALKADGTVVLWGDPAYGHTNVPPEVTNVVSISAGYGWSVAARGDGSVVAWGDGSVGQTAMPDGLRQVLTVAAGYYHGLALSQVPVILDDPPVTVALRPGDSTNLVVSVWSAVPLVYQWYFNQTPLAGVQGTNLAITNFALPQAGIYTVTVTNQNEYLTGGTVVRFTNSPVVLVNGLDVGGGTVSPTDSVVVTMSTSFGGAAPIYYTLDGNDPDFTAYAYEGAFTLTNSALVRAIAYDPAYTSSAQSAPIDIRITPTYPLDVSVPGGGLVTVSPGPYLGTNLYVSNTVVTLTTEAWEGWEFLRWEGDFLGGANPATLAVTKPMAVKVVFGIPLPLQIIGMGQVTTTPESGPYPYGSELSLTAMPFAGAYFHGWAGAASGSQNPLTFPMISTNVLTALFGTLKTNQVALTLQTGPNGAVTLTPDRRVFTRGETVTLTAVPATNYIFAGWGGDVAGTQNPLDLVMDASKLVTGSFTLWIPTNPPVITQQPASWTSSTGVDVPLSVRATGDGLLACQWRRNGVAIEGAVGWDYVVKGLNETLVGSYDAVVTGPAGVTTSAPAYVALFGLELVSSQNQIMPMLALDGALGASYRIEYLPTLTETNWVLLTVTKLSEKRYFYLDEPVTSAQQRYYRALPQ
jgi:hypothetical protein